MTPRASNVAASDATPSVADTSAPAPVRAPLTANRILLVAYHFPPSAAVGGLRMARFARYLPEFGGEPYVLTVDDADRDQEQGNDATRMVGLKNVPIRRTHSRSGRISALYRRVKSLLHGGQGQPGGGTADHDLQGHAIRDGGGARHEAVLRRFKRYVTSLVLLLPDEFKGWSFSSAWTAVHLVRKHRIDWVLTSGPPFSVHFIGLVVKICTRARWIADFRDPWIEMLPERSQHSRSWLSDQLEKWMEASVMRNADKVLTTTERLRQSMIARYPNVAPGKYECLPNGIDLGQMAVRDAVEKDRPLTITYAGSLYFERTPEPLFHALGELVREGIARTSDFRLWLIGNCSHIGNADTLDVARHHGVEASVEILSWLPRVEAVRLMQRSHLLLVLAPPNHKLMLPAKVFDYLGSGSKILAIAEPGATTDFVRETDGGRCFAGTDVSGLKAYLREILEGGRYRYMRNDPATFASHDARTRASQLAAILSARKTQPGQ